MYRAGLGHFRSKRSERALQPRHCLDIPRVCDLVGGELLPEGNVKVFVLTGQSNMEGKGRALHLDTYQDDPLIQPTYTMLKQDGAWVVRDDVWITYEQGSPLLTMFACHPKGSARQRIVVQADLLIGAPPP